MIEEQRKLLRTPPKVSIAPPLQAAIYHKERDCSKLGLSLLKAGKIGCLLIAGGQGTRLAFHGPKGCLPFTPVRQKTLFQYFAEYTLAASRQAKTSIPLAVMTSPLNDAAIKAYFISHKNFGLTHEQLFFFTQPMLPLLDAEGNTFFDAPGQIAQGPDGNGSALQAFFHSPVSTKWRQMGIEQLSWALIDNPLANPLDPQWIGLHAAYHSPLTIKCIERLDPLEKLGVLTENKGEIGVTEYSELPFELACKRHSDGSLFYRFANISLFCFHWDFAQKAASHPLPLHLAKKAVPFLSSEGHIITPKEPWAWKFERFIFDILPLAPKVTPICYPRQETFAPIKDLPSLEKAKKIFTAYERHTLATFTHQQVPPLCEEIDPSFHFPSSALKSQWKNRPIPNMRYVEVSR